MKDLLETHKVAVCQGWGRQAALASLERGGSTNADPPELPLQNHLTALLLPERTVSTTPSHVPKEKDVL